MISGSGEGVEKEAAGFWGVCVCVCVCVCVLTNLVGLFGY
jgi:hypothetical protein